jgi:N-acetylmuramoyl-L-alanine amidase
MKTWPSIGFTVVLLLCGVSCSKVAGKRQRSSSGLEPILGSVDVPKRGSILDAPNTVAGGWAIAEDGVQRVAIYIDKQFITYASLGGDRPDIAKAFPSFPNPGKSGWNVVLDLSSMLEGDHDLVVQVKSNGGNVHDLPPVPFKVVHQSK